MLTNVISVVAFLIGAGINSLICVRFWSSLRKAALLGLVALFFLLQQIWIVIYILLNNSTVVQVHPQLSIDLSENLLRLVFGHLVFPLAAWLTAELTNRKAASDPQYVHTISVSQNRALPWILCVLSTGSLLFYLSRFIVDAPYLSAILAYCNISFFMSPFIIGVTWNRYLSSRITFAATMGLAALYSIAAGSRSLLFLPLVFFIAGLWLASNRKGRTSIVAASVILAIPVFYVSALVETVRKEGVRDRESEVISRVLEMKDLILSAKSGSSLTEGLSQGVGRMVMWSNVVAISTTPEQISYRGFANFWEEIVFTGKSSVSRDSDEYLNEMLEVDFGLGTARKYGFSVSAGGSVPFPILADGWSRAGLLGATVFAFLMCLAWASVEKLINHLCKNHREVAIIHISILASSAYDRMGVYGYVYNVKYLLMQTVLWVVVPHIIYRTYMALFGGALGSGGPRTRKMTK